MTEQYNVSLLKQLPTPQLDAMLRAELEKDVPDEQTVRNILRILRQREADVPVAHNARVDAAWKTYEKKVRHAASGFRRRMLQAAAILALCCVFFFALPQQASAGSLFDRIAAWTEGIFQLFSRSEAKDIREPYIFRTEHPGLQALYDTVAEQGVAVPVVPMWLDDEFALADCKIISTPTTIKVLSAFSGNHNEAVFEFNIYSDNIPREFHKDTQQAIKYENSGIDHYIFENNGLWTVVWARDNIEGFITIDCPEDSVYRIIDSIYSMED